GTVTRTGFPMDSLDGPAKTPKVPAQAAGAVTPGYPSEEPPAQASSAASSAGASWRSASVSNVASEPDGTISALLVAAGCTHLRSATRTADATPAASTSAFRRRVSSSPPSLAAIALASGASIAVADS